MAQVIWIAVDLNKMDGTDMTVSSVCRISIFFLMPPHTHMAAWPEKKRLEFVN